MPKILRRVGEINLINMSYQNQILGTIISSALNYDQLCGLIRETPAIDTSRSSYAPCDGRSIVGSALERLTDVCPQQPDPENHIIIAPDLRGRFMRGLNQIYSVGAPDIEISTADPEGLNRKIGQYQPDGFKQHDHSYTHFDGGVVSDYSNDQASRKASYGNMVGATTGTAGNNSDVETRPRNIAVYYYIKIN